MIADSPYVALQSEDGRALLAALDGFDEEHAAAAAQRARGLASRDIAAAALATVFARRRAVAARKFDHPQDMLFTRAELVRHRNRAVLHPGDSRPRRPGLDHHRARSPGHLAAPPRRDARQRRERERRRPINPASDK